MDRGYEVEIVKRDVICARSRGYLDRARFDDLKNAIDRTLTSAPPQVDLFVDFSALDDFAPGLPIAGLKFAIARAARIRRVAIVTSSRPLAAAIRTFPLIAPQTSIILVSGFDEALAFFAQPFERLGSPAPKHSHERPVAAAVRDEATPTSTRRRAR